MESIIIPNGSLLTASPNNILDLFMDPPEDFLYVGTDEELRNGSATGTQDAADRP